MKNKYESLKDLQKIIDSHKIINDKITIKDDDSNIKIDDNTINNIVLNTEFFDELRELNNKKKIKDIEENMKETTEQASPNVYYKLSYVFTDPIDPYNYKIERKNGIYFSYGKAIKDFDEIKQKIFVSIYNGKDLTGLSNHDYIFKYTRDHIMKQYEEYDPNNYYMDSHISITDEEIIVSIEDLYDSNGHKNDIEGIILKLETCSFKEKSIFNSDAETVI